MIKEEKAGTNFTAVSIGKFDTIGNYLYDPANIPGTFPGKLFLKDILDLTSMELSFNSLEPEKGMPFIHAHTQNEELLICLSGTGEVLIDDERITVKQGSCIRLAPQAERAWRNIGSDQFVFIVVQGKSGSASGTEGSDGFIVQKPLNW